METNGSQMKDGNKKLGMFMICGALIASGIVGILLSTSYTDLGKMGAVSAASPPVNLEYSVVAEDVELEIGPGEVVQTWTFNGTTPGPTLRYTEGDNVTIHFINKTPLPHTLHFHGNHDEKSDGVIPQVMPGQNYTYNFIADPAGAFMYHCHAYPTSLHIRMGMYGLIIVDPKESTLDPAREFGLVLSEFDTDNQDNFVAKYYPVNGYIDQYMGENALEVRQNELVRFYVINIGTTIPYSFHLHSTIFKTYASGLPSNDPVDAQTIEIGPGNAAIVEAKWKWPGNYLFHTHGFQEERGNMGEIRVLPADSELRDAVSLIDWQYQLQKDLQKPKVKTYENLSGILPQQSHHTDGAATVKIANGAWDKNQDNYYDPTEKTVKEGEIVVWINEDTVLHTVTSKELGIFDSSIIAAGKEWQYEFNEEGLYGYFCTLHPWMEGTIRVE
jgi:FtsP/CotA-like multicopper oxidase with cupredoxin domain